MEAIVQSAYGGPEVLESAEVPAPTIDDEHQVLIRVRASSVNPADWVMLTGTPYLARPSLGLRRPRNRIPGKDVAGTVEAVGSAVTRVAVGDDVFGELPAGAYAQYVVADEHAVVTMPPELSYEEAAAMPVAGLTALQGWQKAGLAEGQRALVIGASGGVGTYAVQLAKALGAEVTGVCRTRNIELVRGLGADHVVDYTVDDPTRTGASYDVVFDLVGHHHWADYDRVLAADGVLLPCAGYRHGKVLGPMGWVLGLMARALRSDRSVKMFIANQNDEDMATLSRLVAEGKLRTAIDRQFTLTETADALRHQGEGHAQGKSVISVP
ncbi:MAG: NAD(P)-dependent alcohol dehydrogenase [Actinomycetota bacterium]